MGVSGSAQGKIKNENIDSEKVMRTDHEDDDHIFYIRALMHTRIRDSLVGIVTWLRAAGRGTGFRFPAEARGFLLHEFQIGPWAHAASNTRSIGALYQGVKRQQLEADHSPSSSAVVEVGAAAFPLPYMYSLPVALD
jgi:hypothetical protein